MDKGAAKAEGGTPPRSIPAYMPLLSGGEGIKTKIRFGHLLQPQAWERHGPILKEVNKRFIYSRNQQIKQGALRPRSPYRATAD